MTQFNSLENFNFFRKTALVRIDADVPISPNNIIEDTSRLEAALPTIQHIIKEGGRVVLLAHRGRPKGKPIPELTLKPVTEALSILLKKEVRFCPDCIGRITEQHIEETPYGDVLLLENTRFHPEEEKNDPIFAKKLAEHCDVFVFEAFATSHRNHASTLGVTKYLKTFAGLHILQELEQLNQVLDNPERPLLAIVGGAKISTKIGVLKNILPKADMLMLGGGIANTFLEAKDYAMGRSLLEPNYIETARDILAEAGILGCRILLPQDLTVSKTMDREAPAQHKNVEQLESTDIALDIGPQTTETWVNVIQKAKTIIWAGPVGAFETPPFEKGSFAMAKALSESQAFTIAGGGDTLNCLNKSGYQSGINAISTAGGAFLEYLGGQTSDVIKSLMI